MADVMHTPHVELKRLGFTRTYYEKSLSLANQLYTQTKSYTGPLQGSIGAVEDAIKTYGAPVYAKAEEVVPQILKAVDNQVDQYVGAAEARLAPYALAADRAVKKQKANHSETVSHFNAMREEYLKKIEAALDTIKEKGIAAPTHAAIEGVYTSIDEARKLAVYEYHLVVKTVNIAWLKFIAMPGVASLAQLQEPTIAKAKDAYVAAITAVQTDPRFHKAKEVGHDLLQKLQHNSQYKAYLEKYVEKATPVIAPYYNKTVEMITAAVPTVPSQPPAPKPAAVRNGPTGPVEKKEM